MVPVLTSPKNPKIQEAARLRKPALREKDRRFLVEGAQGVREALAATPPLLNSLFTVDAMDPLAVAAQQAGIEVHLCGPEAIRRITDTVTPPGLVGVASFLDVPVGELPGGGPLVLLHEVRDPGNAGTILRSAAAAGAAGVAFSVASVDPYNPKVVRSSAGSIFHLPMAREVGTVEAIEALRARNVRVFALDASGRSDLYRADLDGEVAFVVGNEARGLDEAVTTVCDGTLRIDQDERAESLNVAAAATVCLFEWRRRRLLDSAS